MPRGIPNSRATETTERRRKSHGRASGLKLAVPEAMLDRKKFAYRWANDKDNRIQALTVADDWDVVHYPAAEGEEQKPVTKVIGTHEGKPLVAVLVRKPKKLYDADKTEALADIDEVEREIRRGGTKHLKGLTDAETTSKDVQSLYTPGGRDGVSGVNIIGETV